MTKEVKWQVETRFQGMTLASDASASPSL